MSGDSVGPSRVETQSDYERVTYLGKELTPGQIVLGTPFYLTSYPLIVLIIGTMTTDDSRMIHGP